MWVRNNVKNEMQKQWKHIDLIIRIENLKVIINNNGIRYKTYPLLSGDDLVTNTSNLLCDLDVSFIVSRTTLDFECINTF